MARSVFALCPYLGTYRIISRDLGACLLYAPIWEPIGQYLGASNNYFPTIYNSHGHSLEVSSLKIIILWRYGIPATIHYKERKL